MVVRGPGVPFPPPVTEIYATYISMRWVQEIVFGSRADVELTCAQEMYN
jgi:hypothetical protein